MQEEGISGCTELAARCGPVPRDEAAEPDLGVWWCGEPTFTLQSLETLAGV